MRACRRRETRLDRRPPRSRPRGACHRPRRSSPRSRRPRRGREPGTHGGQRRIGHDGPALQRDGGEIELPDRGGDGIRTGPGVVMAAHDRGSPARDRPRGRGPFPPVDRREEPLGREIGIGRDEGGDDARKLPTLDRPDEGSGGERPRRDHIRPVCQRGRAAIPAANRHGDREFRGIPGQGNRDRATYRIDVRADDDGPAAWCDPGRRDRAAVAPVDGDYTWPTWATLPPGLRPVFDRKTSIFASGEGT
jgi:hypothetical protein